MSCGALELSPGNISNVPVIYTAISEHESIIVVIIREEGQIRAASPVFTEIFILPIEIRLYVVFNKLSDFRVAAKFTHKNRYAQPLHVS